jgi:hypothetical protein
MLKITIPASFSSPNFGKKKEEKNVIKEGKNLIKEGKNLII